MGKDKVKYLVENSVGRLWLESNPNPDLQKHFKYFIEQEYEAPKDRVMSPEEITVLDPAMGSGHMLVYAFEVLFHIYKSQGYVEDEISEKILNKNLYGLEIDNRATQLAGFALLMKAREYDKNLFNKNISLNLVAIEETPLECPIDEKKYPELNHLWKFFYDAKNYGSILNVEGYDFDKIDEEFASFEKSYSLTAHSERDLVKAIIKQAKIMSSKYDVVVTNPPYMGNKGMNSDLSNYVKKEFPNTKSDLFAVFIEKGFDMLKSEGFNSMVTMQSWMFLGSYEKMRLNLLKKHTTRTLVHMGNMVMNIAFGTSATVWQNKYMSNFKSNFSYVTIKDISNNQEPKEFPVKNERLKNIYSENFLKIPGQPICYWVSERVQNLFSVNKSVNDICSPRQGLATGNNEEFLRFWFESSLNNIGFEINGRSEALESDKQWFPYNKGGSFRKWYGNNEYIVNWKNDGELIRKYTKGNSQKISSRPQNMGFYFKKGITWSLTSSSNSFGARYKDKGFIFDVNGMSVFPDNYFIYYLNGFLCSKICYNILLLVNPTMAFQVGDVGKLPIVNANNSSVKERINQLTQECIDISKEEWDSRETSWDFKLNELFKHEDDSNKLDVAFRNYCKYWEEKFFKLHKNEEELNQLFIDIYDLNDELDNKVPLEEITILKDETSIKDDKLVFKKEVIVKQFLSYIVGCIFGRYSPERDGLILANQGDTLKEFDVDAKFMPVEDNIILISDKSYFPDDIVGKVKEFLRTYFGNNSISENLDFIASGLKGSGSSEEKLRRYFLKDFFKDHVKMYKKKPIYWLFSSGKEKGFNALIYMHRYNKELLAKMRTDYLHVLQGKIDAKLNSLKDDASEREVLSKQFEEMKKFDALLNNKALEFIEIDLDDGVTVNYQKFKELLEGI